MVTPSYGANDFMSTASFYTPPDRTYFFYFTTARNSPTFFFFFFNDPATTEIYPLPLHAPLPILAINTAKNAVVSRDRSPIEYDLDRNNDESYDMQGRMKDSETPEGLVLTEEIRSTVNAAIDALPEDLRTAIVLRELEGLSYEEIAAAMACPVGTVRSRIFRAREAIDRRLREVFEGGLGRAEELG